MTTTYDDIVSAARSVSDRLVTVDDHGDHAVVTLDDPGKRNVLSAALMIQLRETCEALVARPGLRTVILTGAGGSFSAGGDLRMMRTAVEQRTDPDDREGAWLPYQWINQQFGGMARTVAKSPVAFVAAVDGAAAGVGLAFALTCDVVVASDRAAVVPAFGRLGLLPEVGTSWALTRALGYRRSFAYFVKGEPIDAAQALDLGLVDEVVPAAELLEVARGWAARIAALPPHVVPLAKPLLRNAADATWDQAIAMEEYAEPICFTTGGFADGTAAVVAAVSHGR